MKYRIVPGTNLKLSEIGFGAWTLGSEWWGNITDEESIALVQRALELGINFFDTADQYGSGKSETLLAQALKGKRDQVIIASKFGYDFYTHKERIRHEEKPQKFDPQYIRFALEQSLQRLQTDVIDLYQLHNPRIDVIHQDEVFETLEKLKEEGKIRYYGVALGPDIGWFEEGEASMKERRVATLQIIYSILEQDPARGFFPIAEECGTGLMVRVPHASGLLDGTYTKDTVFPESDHRSYRKQEWLLEGLAKVDRVSFLYEERGMTIGQAALKFSLAPSTITSVLLTVTNIQQLEEFAKAPECPDFSPEELAKVAELYDHQFYFSSTPFLT